MKPGPTITISLTTTAAGGAEFGRQVVVPADDEQVVRGVRRLLRGLRSTPEPTLQAVPKVPVKGDRD